MLFDPPRRRTLLFRIGFSLTAAFLLLRAINIYGDPAPWSTKFPGMTVLSFLRTTKYPPSLDFLLMTLGPALVVLALFDGVKFARTNPLLVFGRVPLFYFLVHFYLIHILTVIFGYIRYGDGSFLLAPLPTMGGPGKLPPGFGYSLPVVYAIWICLVVFLYPLCLWFSRLKERRRDWWLSYL
jgi:hypothetical protein